MTAADKSTTVMEVSSRESSSVEHSGSTVKPRRSLTAAPTDVLNELQAEDLSRTGKQQRRELGIRTEQSWQSTGNNSQMARVADTVVGNIQYAHNGNTESGRSVASFVDEEGFEPVHSPSVSYTHLTLPTNREV